MMCSFSLFSPFPSLFAFESFFLMRAFNFRRDLFFQGALGFRGFCLGFRVRGLFSRLFFLAFNGPARLFYALLVISLRT